MFENRILVFEHSFYFSIMKRWYITILEHSIYFNFVSYITFTFAGHEQRRQERAAVHALRHQLQQRARAVPQGHHPFAPAVAIAFICCALRPTSCCCCCWMLVEHSVLCLRARRQRVREQHGSLAGSGWLCARATDRAPPLRPHPRPFLERETAPAEPEHSHHHLKIRYPLSNMPRSWTSLVAYASHTWLYSYLISLLQQSDSHNWYGITYYTMDLHQYANIDVGASRGSTAILLPESPPRRQPGGFLHLKIDQDFTARGRNRQRREAMKSHL